MKTITNIIEELTPDEQALIGRLVQKIKERKKNNKVTELSIVNTLLMSDRLDYSDGSFLPEIASMTAPCLVKEYKEAEITILPQDFLPLTGSLQEIITGRSSQRDYTDDASISLNELSTLLFYSYGTRGYFSAYNTTDFPLRMVPSAGGLQGVELYLFIRRVEKLQQGIYHYNPFDHSVELLEEGAFRRKVVNACVGQEFVGNAGAVIILSCVLGRLLWKYKNRAYRYAHVDTGIVTQNIYLVGNALKLGICAISGFFDGDMNVMLRISDIEEEFVSLAIAVGKVKNN